MLISWMEGQLNPKNEIQKANLAQFGRKLIGKIPPDRFEYGEIFPMSFRPSILPHLGPFNSLFRVKVF